MIGDKIRTCRNAKGITQEELAATAGFSLAAIQSYEENKWKPGTNTVARLADVLEVSILDLIEGCTAIYDDSGDVLLVETNDGHQIKVVGRVSKKETVCSI